MSKKKLIIIGGGFAGSYLAKKLENDFSVYLIDNKDYFEFTPGILRTIIEPEHAKKIQQLHKNYLKKAKICIGNVSEIGDDFVVWNKNKLKFDYLAICSGSTYSSPFKESNLVIATRADNLINCHRKLEKAKNVLIIGGGLAGTELASEIITRYKDKEIFIVHNKDRLLERNNEEVKCYAENFLKKRGVKIIFNEEVISYKDKIFTTNKGTNIKPDMIFACTGIMPNYDFIKKNFSHLLTKKNQIKVNHYLQLEGKNNIFAAGDVNSRIEEKTAQNARRQAKFIIKNIRALENGKNLKVYSEKKTPLIVNLGKWDGIFTTGKLNLFGLIPGLLKTMIEKRIMFEYKGVFALF